MSWLRLETSIHAAVFFWTDDVLTERTIERLAAGVEVLGVLDQLGAGNVASDDKALCAAGPHIGIEDFAGKLHHEFAVIDVFGDDPVVILGSYNRTDSGAYDYDENTLIIHDANLALAYYAEWQTLWNAIDAEDKCNQFSVYQPAVFK
jgi:phosphatidylserine/phosphatidylglycerophosphate/cardiolipin synthase-like enzyme